MAEEQQYIWLNGERLPIRGPIQWQRITPFPAQFATSAPTEADYTPTRKQRWGSLRGGMGIEKWDSEHNDRYWEADGVDASMNVQTLGPLVTTMGTFGAEPVKILKYKERVWAIGHRKISYWDGTAWQAVKEDFDNPTDAAIFYGAG